MCRLCKLQALESSRQPCMHQQLLTGTLVPHLQPFASTPAAAKQSCWTSWQSMQLAWSRGLPRVSAKPGSWRPWVSLHWEQQGLPVLHEPECKEVCAAALSPVPINILHDVFMMLIPFVTSWSMWGPALPTLQAQLLLTPLGSFCQLQWDSCICMQLPSVWPHPHLCRLCK